MKPKSALFVSAALTTFVLAILASLLSGFNSARTSQAVAAASPTQQVLATDVPTQPDATATQPTQPAQIGPEQAAQLAAQYTKKTDVYSVESFSLNGVNAYKVVFSSGAIVYVGLDGTILASPKPTPASVTTTFNPTVTPKKHHHSSSGSSGGGGGGGSGGGGGGEDGGGDN